ncbi:uncharacterized protein TNCV_2736781 [Trichonephila clavipes]|nr:uncharacterized protein TNCV_2736781 [Trichonephila clavipes]
MTRRKSLRPDEIANLLRKLSENESGGGELFCSNLDFDANIRVSKSDCEESEASADEIDKISVNLDIYVSRDDTERIPHKSNVPGRFASRNALTGLYVTFN